MAVNAGYKADMETQGKRPVGRPRYPAGKVRNCDVNLKLTETERDAVKRAAARREMPVNVYLRALVAADIAADGASVS